MTCFNSVAAINLQFFVLCWANVELDYIFQAPLQLLRNTVMRMRHTDYLQAELVKVLAQAPCSLSSLTCWPDAELQYRTPRSGGRAPEGKGSGSCLEQRPSSSYPIPSQSAQDWEV